MTADAFIGLLREEYKIRKNCIDAGRTNGSTNLVTNQTNAGPSKTLQARIEGDKSKTGPYCDHCKRAGHWTSRCRKNPANKCYNCGKLGHHAHECRSKKKDKGRDKDKSRDKGKGKAVGDQTNMVEEEITFVVDEEAYNFDTYEMYNTSAIDERLIYYDWLADNATTSHVACQKESFTTYTPVGNVSVSGVGGKEATIAGRGIVDLISTCNGHTYNLRLENVLHVPGQRNNLISLGRWDAAGGRYLGGKGELTLVTKDGKHVANGKKLDKHLYKMDVSVKRSPSTSACDETFNNQVTPLSWETWHRRYGHVGYTGLQKLLDGNMVEGLIVDDQTDKPDCVACTEAKQHIETFPKSTTRQTEAGELTHIDLWGKYAVKSIHGNQYYLLFVDDAKRYITATCLKEKTDAAQGVIDYLQHLLTQGRNPKAIQIDGGKEFVNETLKKWCREHGVEIHMTAPYSPSQNGVAERMNRTLVELSRAMLRAQDLPEFLWEYALLNAVYVRNRSFTTHLGNYTPFEGWFKRKPNVSHLREFGAPVWVLLQGQKEDRKMLPKSKRQVYVGFDDGAKAVKYFNAETRKVLTSRNFRTINPPPETPPEPIIITPAPQHEGESGRSDMPLVGEKDSDGTNQDQPNQRKRKRREEGAEKTSVDTVEPRKTRGIRTDYKHLNERGNRTEYLEDPFNEGDDETSLITEEMYAVIAGDELTSLAEAKQSPEWPKWKVSIHEELDTLNEKGTWELVPKPPGVVPISNKWTFVKKRNKEGIVTRYRARLVVKGFTQRPGYDYAETFSPVVRMDTLRAILALVPKKKLKVQQMDVKGAYLNGVLKEKLHMKQPEGFEDGTDRVCLLIKTIYGLKQAGREWNRQLDEKLREHGYTRLRSDPCVYVRWSGGCIAIITVWVDDLMLFASSDEMMDHMKKPSNPSGKSPILESPER